MTEILSLDPRAPGVSVNLFGEDGPSTPGVSAKPFGGGRIYTPTPPPPGGPTTSGVSANPFRDRVDPPPPPEALTRRMSDVSANPFGGDPLPRTLERRV